MAWLSDALERAKGKFILAVVGHPKYAAGVDTSKGDPAFARLYNMLEHAGANVLMAGDTHDFEFYRPPATGADTDGSDANGEKKNGRAPPLYIVNGGGGAYLSIGGALAWPADVPATSWGFYPAAQEIRTKLDTETPLWKQPFWQWIKRFGAWPIAVETLSGMFDFNRAPFYQSFMEIRIERSKQRVVFALHGVNGPLRWRDLQLSPDAAAGHRPDDVVEFVVPMTGTTK